MGVGWGGEWEEAGAGAGGGSPVMSRDEKKEKPVQSTINICEENKQQAKKTVTDYFYHR